ncbi:hypothetical protein EVG20_g2309 [Dentipellis fragilis]|uniref:Glutamine amidotransferase type-2 domain-containing protein n=1 Tax=Dentipellis fragilis TaxID=205917 RepID=A0A4Y9ZBE1_9AGAM|nr:hypothetical protein EVG20_g2309 [Dentipellis fragilis]
MCGIVLSARWTANNAETTSQEDLSFQDLQNALLRANTSRGPDAQQVRRITLEEQLQKLHVDFFASELRLRGDAPVVQPHVDEEKGDILCWNGEIFKGLDVGFFSNASSGLSWTDVLQVNAHENDGVKLFSSITQCESADDIVQFFGQMEGPYAFAYYRPASQQLFFARDPLGRRSLLIHKPSQKNPYFLLASVSLGANPAYDFAELSTEHIYSLDLGKLSASEDATVNFEHCLHAYPRQPVSSSSTSSKLPYAKASYVNTTLPPLDSEPPQLESLDNIPEYLLSPVDGFISRLSESVLRRVQDIPSTFDDISSSTDKVPESRPARVAVLFSGGIDSTMLAYLADQHLPLDEPIDLLNVAFENPRKIQVKVDGNIGGLSKKQKKQKDRSVVINLVESGQYNHDYLVPDRVTGLQEVEELRRLSPRRVWNFVEVDVPYAESRAAKPAVEAVMWPGRTVMDLSLAMALYFAARGIGQVRSSPDIPPTPYTSPARVLLNGLGSDELLGGYGRHRTAYSTGGWQAVIDELQLEIVRIPTRNLGRDDRVISSHGKETRHPFLSLDVVAFLAGLPVHHKMDPRLEIGLGDKMLLRLAARKVGLVEASARKKRAMQFGSHSARMELGVTSGSGHTLLS